MNDTTANSEIARGKAHFLETLGSIPEPIRAMMEYAPEAFAGFLKFREAVYRTPKAGGHLDMKTKEMIYTLLDIVSGNLEGAKNHCRAAFTAGLTSRELAEGCMLVMQVCGVTTWGKTGYKVVDFIAELERSGNSPPR